MRRRSVLRLLASYLQGRAAEDAGALDRAIHFAQQLTSMVPEDPAARRLLEQLQKQRRR